MLESVGGETGWECSLGDLIIIHLQHLSHISTAMSPTKQPRSLFNLAQRSVEVKILSSEGQSDEVWMRSVGEMIPQSIADDILELVINSEDHHCSQHYNLLLSPKIRKLKLQKYFDWLQSLLIEAATQCTNLQEIFISADVMDNCHDDIREFLNSVNSSKLKSLSLKIPSKLQSSVATESSLRTMFHNINVDNMSALEHLDIAGINIDESCLQSILKMKKLKSLILNDCKMSTIQAVQILTGMSWLKQFECSYGKQSKVIQALSSLPRGTRLRLEYNPWWHGLRERCGGCVVVTLHQRQECKVKRIFFSNRGHFIDH